MPRASRRAASVNTVFSSRAISAWLQRALWSHAVALRILHTAVWPIGDVCLRIGLAQSFIISGLLKVTHWDTALALAATEYPVRWMSPTAAAYTGVLVELIPPILLSFGLLTRYAAIPLLILTLVVQVNYRAFDSQLCTAILLGWYSVHGSGAISLDRALRRGLGDSALPLAPALIRVSSLLRARLSPCYLLLIRLWLGASLIGLNVEWLRPWLPLSTLDLLPKIITVAAGALFLIGLGNRWVAAFLASLLLGEGMIPGSAASSPIYLVAILGLLVVQGAGWPSLDSLVYIRCRRLCPSLDGKPGFDLEGLPRVVIVGAGFAGVSCAMGLRNARVSVTLIDRANHHLFQPLLYQVATAAINPSDVATPIRTLFREAFNTNVLLGAVTAVDTERRVVKTELRELSYDYLVLATGATHSYFGKDEWATHAPGLKRVEDATAIRRKLLRAFELAEAAEEIDERNALLTFLVVGGGPTGVELAGAIAELSRYGMEKEFRRFDPASARVLLVQSAKRILPTFDEKLSAIAQRSLEKLGVTVMLGSRVESIDEQGVLVNGQRIYSRTVLWAAGVKASAAASWLKCTADAAGRVSVEGDLGVPNTVNVFAAGDTAMSRAWSGEPVPGLAPAAKQAGRYVARVIRARIEGYSPPPPFQYRHFGSLATIGRQAAVADFTVVKVWGAPAWWLWGCIHLGFLVGVRNRVSTMVNWFWAYLTAGNGIKLITDPDPAAVDSRA